MMRFKKIFAEKFRTLNCNQKINPNSHATIYTPNRLYQTRIPIKKENYNDILSLFNTKPPSIPIQNKVYFENLPFYEAGSKRECPQSQSELISENE